ncbi:MAG: RHS repeat-associated core domain-containing protein [Thermomicrobiales bacterium]
MRLSGDDAKFWRGVGGRCAEWVTRSQYHFGGSIVARRTVAGSTNTVVYLHGDPLGSVSVATSSTGTVLDRQEYGPWGNIRSGGVSETTLNYTGQQRDGTGLLYYGARYYDPALGRFLSPDSIGVNPVNPQSLNRYSYVGNNPLNHTDPSGHCSSDDPGCEYNRGDNNGPPGGSDGCGGCSSGTDGTGNTDLFGASLGGNGLFDTGVIDQPATDTTLITSCGDFCNVGGDTVITAPGPSVEMGSLITSPGPTVDLGILITAPGPTPDLGKLITSPGDFTNPIGRAYAFSE